MRNVKKFLGMYVYGMYQELFCVEHEICVQTVRKIICKLEPGRDAEVARNVKKSSGLYAYGTSR